MKCHRIPSLGCGLLLVLSFACRPPVEEDTTVVVDDDSDSSGGSETGEVTVPPAPAAVILFIGDGMGFAHVAGGGMYAHGEAGTLTMETLPWSGRLRTASLTGYTDSAAAATAMATGAKTYNAYLGLDRDAESVTSVLELARERGMATGVVSTDQLTGATPSAFQVHVPSRYDTDAVAAQWLVDMPDVSLGGGASTLEEGMSVLDVQLLSTPEALASVEGDGRPIVGLFADSTLPYVYDVINEVDPDALPTPTLAEMVHHAIRLLSTDEEGFFLVVEGARIDHASHSNAGSKVHLETVAFDEAVAVALDWVETQEAADPDYETTLVVTADHECGGMEVSGEGTAGLVPTTTWRWRDHTNVDVPVFARGDRAEVFDGQRMDNTWVHSVLESAIERTDIVSPDIPRVADGWTEDLVEPQSTQVHETSFGVGYNQLDGLRVTADTEGLWIGLDGVFEWEENAVVVLIDMDYGAGTGWLADEASAPDDQTGDLDSLLSALSLSTEVSGLGFDLALASIGGLEIRDGGANELVGLRGLHGDWGEPTDLWWYNVILNFDDGNLSGDAVAPDAGATGETAGGMEAQIPWSTLYSDEARSRERSVAVAAVLVNDGGSVGSNQALPPYEAADEPGLDPLPIVDVVTLEIDASGTVSD